MLYSHSYIWVLASQVAQRTSYVSLLTSFKDNIMCKMIHSHIVLQSLIEDRESYRFFSKTFTQNFSCEQHPSIVPSRIYTWLTSVKWQSICWWGLGEKNVPILFSVYMMHTYFKLSLESIHWQLFAFLCKSQSYSPYN